MVGRRATTGQFANGLAHLEAGRGPRPLVVFDGLWLNNTPTRFSVGMYRFLAGAYTVYVVARRRAMPVGYSLSDMAADYATAIESEFGEPVDIIGVSTGGSLALVFAAEHPELVNKLVVHSAAHRLSDDALELQRETAARASRRDWRGTYACMFSPIVPKRGPMRAPAKVLVKLMAAAFTLRPPKEASDFVTIVAAEEQLAFADRLHQITAPTLVVAGAKDPYYSPALFGETAEGIANARLVLYENKGHAPSHSQFQRDVRDFLLSRKPSA